MSKLPTEEGRKALEANYGILSADEKRTADTLVANDQAHLFAHWPAPGTQDDDKHRFLSQCALIESAYLGGIETYVKRARELLKAAQLGANPYEGYRVEEPTDSARIDSPELFNQYESQGLNAASGAAFVLVAGGLGERLGYKGIKLALPSEIVTGKPYIQLYIEFILALQSRARAITGNQSLEIPLGIMTSDDTHKLTEALLKQNNNFGMSDKQLVIFKQGKVPSMVDNDAHFTLEESDKYALDTKPHGHGDVHMLLYQNGIIHKWVRENGVKHVVFFQDTNGLVFRALIAGLGVSVSKQLQVNSLTVPRVQGDAVGAICKLVRDPSIQRQEGAEQLADVLTMSVEYNQLEGLMGKGVKEPLVPGTNNSVYPGNINVLIFDAVAYLDVLEAKKGVISEFVNPKYNPDKQSFKKPTRLECMMQDWAKLLDKDARVGFSEFQRWSSFSAVKNALSDAVAKQKAGNAPESGASGEADMYMWTYHILKEAGVAIDEPKKKDFQGVTVDLPPRVVLAPKFGVTQQEVKSKFVGQSAIKIHDDSTVVLDGSGITVKSMDVAGALIVKAVEGANVSIDQLTVKNDGWKLKELSSSDKVDQIYEIRGYQLDKRAADQYVFDKPGDYVLSDSTKGQYLRN